MERVCNLNVLLSLFAFGYASEHGHVRVECLATLSDERYPRHLVVTVLAFGFAGGDIVMVDKGLDMFGTGGIANVQCILEHTEF